MTPRRHATDFDCMLFAQADNVVALVNGCIAPQIAEGGDCTATNGLWEMAYVYV